MFITEKEEEFLDELKVLFNKYNIELYNDGVKWVLDNNFDNRNDETAIYLDMYSIKKYIDK